MNAMSLLFLLRDCCNIILEHIDSLAGLSFGNAI